jgi:GrpB-like predicted nucleotidyltransferase (UPF0157 family)
MRLNAVPEIRHHYQRVKRELTSSVRTETTEAAHYSRECLLLLTVL